MAQHNHYTENGKTSREIFSFIKFITSFNSSTAYSTSSSANAKSPCSTWTEVSQVKVKSKYTHLVGTYIATLSWLDSDP